VKDLVVWGELDTLGSTVGTQWTTAQRAFYVLSNLPPPRIFEEFLLVYYLVMHFFF
jgi:hypothetical protein